MNRPGALHAFLLAALAIVTSAASPLPLDVERLGPRTPLSEVDQDIVSALGTVPAFIRKLTARDRKREWRRFKSLQLNANSALPPKYKELVALAVASHLHSAEWAYFHRARARRLFAANNAEVAAAAQVGATAAELDCVLGLEDNRQSQAEVAKLLSFMNLRLLGQPSERAQLPGMAPGADWALTYLDISNEWGQVPSFLAHYPKTSLRDTWAHWKSSLLDPDSLPVRYKNLIALAVSVSSPGCPACSSLYQGMAVLNGASAQEVSETVALAAGVRHWSDLTGDSLSMRIETDRIVGFEARVFEARPR